MEGYLISVDILQLLSLFVYGRYGKQIGSNESQPVKEALVAAPVDSADLFFSIFLLQKKSIAPHHMNCPSIKSETGSKKENELLTQRTRRNS